MIGANNSSLSRKFKPQNKWEKLRHFGFLSLRSNALVQSSGDIDSDEAWLNFNSAEMG